MGVKPPNLPVGTPVTRNIHRASPVATRALVVTSHVTAPYKLSSCLKMFFLLVMMNLRYCLLVAVAWNSHI